MGRLNKEQQEIVNIASAKTMDDIFGTPTRFFNFMCLVCFAMHCHPLFLLVSWANYLPGHVYIQIFQAIAFAISSFVLIPRIIKDTGLHGTDTSKG